ncbi:MAG: O-antigen ligase family protein [Candidatus Gracilibacteria bacterium]|nr:O-antigen ligase family protein [Candidatus Gracilibacteria bacterium]
MDKKIDKLIYRGLILLLALLPFHAFFKTWFSSLLTETNIDYLSLGSFVIGSWKEILIACLLVLVLIKILHEKKWPFHFHKVDIVLLAFSLILLISPLWNKFDLAAYFWALKTNLAFVLLYFIIRSIAWDRKRIDLVMQVILGSALIVIVFGLILYFFLPKDFLQNFGYTPYISSYVDEKPLPFVHGMGEELAIPRLASTLSGPNQFGSYLLIILGIVFASIFHKYNLGKRKAQYFELFLGALACLVLTFSRAAWLGFLGAALIVFLSRIDLKKQGKQLLLIIVCLLAVTFTIFLGNTGLRQDYLLRLSSTMGHYEQTLEGLEIVKENPWGLGMGQAGPVSRRIYGEEAGIISENWYLQIAQEAGLVALLLWFAFLYLAFKDYWRQNTFLATASFFLLLAISIDALFLHAWTDSVTALIAFSVIGISFSFAPESE